MPTLPTQTFNTLDEWQAWIDNNIITNGVESITGNDGNITENAAVKFIRQSPLNWEKIQIFSSGGAVTPSRPVVMFMTTTPTSLTFGDNVYNEYIFINTTNGDIPLNIPTQYFDINLQAVTIIPKKSIVNVGKTNNNAWVVMSVPSQGSQPTLPLFKFVVDSGKPDNPVSGTSIWQSNLLKNLGAAYDNQIEITLDSGTLANYGTNQNMTYDPVTGTIDLDYNGTGNTWQAGSGGSVDLNQ